MDRNIVLRKIIDGAYDTQITAFLRSYDDIFKWAISIEKNNILSTTIYSIDFLRVWNDDAKILEPHLSDDTMIVEVNYSILPRYGFTLTQWLKDLHACSNILSNYLINDVILMIISYIL